MTTQHKSLMERLRSRDLRVLDRGPIAYTVSNALHYGLRVAMRRQIARNQSWISDEYQLTKRFDWRENLSLDDLIMSDDREEKWILEGGKVARGTERVVREYLLMRLRNRIAEFLPDGQGRVIEFGCGTGRNLFYLARTFPQLDLVGIELTSSTVDYAREIAQREGYRVTFHVGDMTADTSPLGKADVVFSVHALEQLPEDFGKAFDNMVGAAQDAVVLFEPVHELFPWSLRGVAARLRLKTANYLSGLMSHISTKPQLEVTHALPLPYGKPLNQTVEIVAKLR